MQPDGSMDQEAMLVPEFLYKFRRWKDEKGNDYKYDQLILTHLAVWFASPADFNDPFDCKIPYRFDLMSREDQYQRVYQIGRKTFPSWDSEKLKMETEKELRSNPLFSRDAEVASGAWEKYYNLIAKTYGVLSFAGNRKSILMWSHYADSHNGYCVEVDGKALAYQLFNLSHTDDVYIGFRRVQYEKDLPEVIPTNDEEEDLERHQSLLSSKSRDWSYEQEYRFIYVGKTRLSRYINPDVIKRVILGCLMPQDHREEIAEIVHAKLPNTELWEAVRSNDKFKLDFRPWNPEGK